MTCGQQHGTHHRSGEPRATLVPLQLLVSFLPPRLSLCVHKPAQLFHLNPAGPSSSKTLLGHVLASSDLTDQPGSGDCSHLAQGCGHWHQLAGSVWDTPAQKGHGNGHRSGQRAVPQGDTWDGGNWALACLPMRPSHP